MKANTPTAGDKFPSAHVLGIDLSPIQPYYAPPNVEWKIDDLEAEWPPAYQNADYIHAWSFLNTISDPERLLASARRYVLPPHGCTYTSPLIHSAFPSLLPLRVSDVYCPHLLHPQLLTDK